jgi:hypothetical protein
MQEETAQWVGRGYHVVSQTETSTQLVKPKKFSLAAFFLLAGIFYLPFYLAKKDQTVYLFTEGGEVHRKGGSRKLGQLIADKIRGHA